MFLRKVYTRNEKKKGGRQRAREACKEVDEREHPTYMEKYRL